MDVGQGPRIRVVTVSHNSELLLGGFLRRLAAGTDVEVVVVDSGSANWMTVRDVIRRSGARWLGIVQNVGYGTASNRGASGCAAEWIAFVNPDVEISAPDLLLLAEAGSRGGYTIMQPALVVSAGAHRQVPADSPVIDTRILRGACFLIRKAAFDAVAGFDERFFMFAEEDDLARRLVARGDRIGVLMSVEAATVGGASSPGTSRRWAVAEREVATVQLLYKRFGPMSLPYSLLRLGWRIVANREMRPRRRSCAQIWAGLRRVRRAWAYGPVRHDLTFRPDADVSVVLQSSLSR